MSLCGKCHDTIHNEQPAPSGLQVTTVLPGMNVEKKETKRVIRKKTTKGYSVFVESLGKIE
jgi:hypothetical protein